MNIRSMTISGGFLLLLCLAAPAQVSPGSVGLMWINVNGTTLGGTAGCGAAGSFSCVIETGSVAVGDQVIIQVRGQFNGAYVLALSLASLPCTQVPGVLNQLLLDPTQILALAPGIMHVPSPILACPSGGAALSLVWPQIGSGQQFYLQAAATGPAGQLAFTNAIQITTL